MKEKWGKGEQKSNPRKKKKRYIYVVVHIAQKKKK